MKKKRMMMMSNKIWVLRKNQMKMPTDRSLIGQKLDFRVSHDQFEMLISLRSGGLPSAPKSKKWIDKVDLAVALRDVLINEGIENNGVDPDKFHYRSSFIQL